LLAEKPIQFHPAANGTLNDMFVIDCADGARYYWKRFLPHLDAPWLESPEDRMGVELGALQQFRDVLGAEIGLPAALMVDETEHWVLLSDACPVRGRNWEQAFLESDPEISACLAARLGATLGKLARCAPDRPLRASFDADSAHWDKWLLLRTLAPLRHDPAISQRSKDALLELYEEACACTVQCLMHVDFIPKNIMVSWNVAGLVDFELSTTIGDALFELGFFLGHVGLLLVNRNRTVDRAWATVLERIATSYLSQLQLDSAQQQRVMRYAGATIIYRLTGAMRPAYLDPRLIPQQLALAECLLTSRASIHEYPCFLAMKGLIS
jgi:aminoglycoside phosphotransferase (APT) family kinase protein